MDEIQRLQEIKVDPYWEAQVRATQVLSQVGIVYKLEDRIPPMRVMQQLLKMLKKDSLPPPKLQAIREAIRALQIIVHLRVNGLEPQHNKNKYIS